MDQQKWTDEVENACRAARNKGLVGNLFNVSLFTTSGKIYDGSISLNDSLATKQQHMKTEYPHVETPAILRIQDVRYSTFEIGIKPEGVLLASAVATA
jgi:hypothetical protein